MSSRVGSRRGVIRRNMIGGIAGAAGLAAAAASGDIVGAARAQSSPRTRSGDEDPWTWPTETWRSIVDHVRAGRSLKPSSWKGGATCAIALSFDSDHETIDLRNGGKSFSRMSQGQYGARAGVP